MTPLWHFGQDRSPPYDMSAFPRCIKILREKIALKPPAQWTKWCAGGNLMTNLNILYDLLKHSQISILFYHFSLFSLFCLSFSLFSTICICQLTLWPDPPPLMTPLWHLGLDPPPPGRQLICEWSLNRLETIHIYQLTLRRGGGLDPSVIMVSSGGALVICQLTYANSG